MVKEGTVHYIENGELFESPNTKTHKHVAALIVRGIPETDRHKFGVCVYDENNYIRVLGPKWPSLAEAKHAAKAIAIIAPQNFACAIVINDIKNSS